MPNYTQREDNAEMTGSTLDLLNSYGANKIVPKREEEPPQPNELLNGGSVEDINQSNTPHKEMIRAVLKMKPKDIHILKRGAKYFLDNPQDLEDDIDEQSLDDLSHTINSNDLADMLETDYEMTKGGEALDGGSLLYDLGRLLNNIPKVQKIINV